MHLNLAQSVGSILDPSDQSLSQRHELSFANLGWVDKNSNLSARLQYMGLPHSLFLQRHLLQSFKAFNTFCQLLTLDPRATRC
jgi:hypothetical protein